MNLFEGRDGQNVRSQLMSYDDVIIIFNYFKKTHYKTSR